METIIIILITILGIIMGSFLGCMGYRIPNKIKTTFPPSFCNECKQPLKWYMNIPILSYIFLRGKCAYCKKPINFIYPFVEIASGLLFLCNYLMFDISFEFFISTILACILIVTIVSDFLYYYISDRVLVIGGIFILITLFVFKNYNDVFYSIISGTLLFIIMIGIKYLGNLIFKKESLGDGDIKLMAIVGLSLGIMNSLVCLFIASIIGLIFSTVAHKKIKDGIIPFGPFLLIGAIMVMYFSEYINYFISLI